MGAFNWRGVCARYTALISYNTENFIRNACDYLISINKADWYFAIHHNAEKTETKDHFHILIKFCDEYKKDDLRQLFTEVVDPFTPALCILPPEAISKPEEVVRYDLHDTAYLSIKNLNRKYVDYPIESAITSSLEVAKALYDEFDVWHGLTAIEKIELCIDTDMSLRDALKKCNVNFSQLRGFESIYDRMKAFKRQEEMKRRNADKITELLGESPSEVVQEETIGILK